MLKNNTILGILIGCIIPGLAFAVFGYWYKGFVLMHKREFPYFIAIGLNLLLIRYAHHNNADRTSRGIMISTFVFMILIFLIKVGL